MPKIVLIVFTALVLIVFRPLPVLAQDAVPPAAGVWRAGDIPHLLQGAPRDRLVASLRRITGIVRLGFDTNGRLEMDGATRRGSATARRILNQVSASGDIFVLQDHSGSDLVNFGQIEGMDYLDYTTGRRAQVWWIRLDFTDFQKIAAPARVRATFDEGFTLFHEMLHGLGHRDAATEGALGECETILNQVRDELGLPLRAEYFATRIGEVVKGVAAVRLGFLDRPAGFGNQMRYLRFALAVGPRALAHATTSRH
jgi:hypothetical protein